MFFVPLFSVTACLSPKSVSPRREGGGVKTVEVVEDKREKKPVPVESSGDEGRPLFFAPLENPHDFSLLANGGFDPGWRVGYGSAWVVQLPPAPAAPASGGRWRKAYVGARLGRAKWESVPGRPAWEKRRVKGSIDVALAGEPLWPQSRRFFLARTEDLPMEGDPDNAVEGVGESRWFWTEVPLKAVSFTGPNFIALYAPSESLKSPDRSPVLAAGFKAGVRADVNVWLSGPVRGQPPLGSEQAFKTPVHTFAPAVAIKLVPENARAVNIEIVGPGEGATLSGPTMVEASVMGTDVSRVWVETSTDTKKWTAAGPALISPPFTFTLRPDRLPAGDLWWRVGAADLWENRSHSDPRRVIVPVSPGRRR